MRTIERAIVATLLLIIGGLDGAAVLAHGGAGRDGAPCVLRLGAWRMEVSLYQPATRDGELYCDVVPGFGATVMVFDVLDDALREMPVELRLVRGGSSSAALVNSGWDDAALAAATVAQLPARTYPQGAMVLRREFADAGPYLALLRAAAPGGGEWRAAFPVTVSSSATRWRAAMLVIGATMSGCALLLWASRRGARQRAAEIPSQPRGEHA